MNNLRKIIREIIFELLETTSVSGMAGGDAYDTPFAFTGNSEKNKKLKKKKLKKSMPGWELPDEKKHSMFYVDSLKEGRSRYHNFRDDDTMSNQKKINNSMREIYKNLNEINHLMNMNLKLKHENEITNDSYWKRTNKSLEKITGMIESIQHKIFRFRGE